MKFKFQIADGEILTLDRNIWTGQVNVLLGSKALGKWNNFKKDPISVPLRNGGDAKLTLKIGWFDPAPRAFVDGSEVQYARQLKKWEQAVACIPLGLALSGGAIPVVVALVCVYVNYWLMRNNDMEPPVRWTLVGFTPVIGLGVLLLLSTALFTIFPVKQHAHGKHGHQGYFLQTKNTGPIKKWTENDDLPPLAKPRYEE